RRADVKTSGPKEDGQADGRMLAWGDLTHSPRRPGTTAICVRREKAALSSGCKSHPANAPAGSNRSSHGGDEMAEAFGVARHILGDGARVRAATRVTPG